MEQSIQLQRIRLESAKGILFLFGGAAGGVPKTSQNLRVWSAAAAADATVDPSGLCVMCSTLEV